MSELELMNKIEAVLFLAARFLTIDEIVRLTDVNPIMLKELLVKVEQKYNKQRGALHIIRREVQGQVYYKMDIKQQYTNYVNKIASGKSEFTRAEKSTLAVIAYKQPIKQSVIVKIRGNKAYDHIKKFFDLGLIKKKKTGHTYELSLSDDFYDYFNIESNTKNPLKAVSSEILEKK